MGTPAVGKGISMQQWDGKRATTCCGPQPCPHKPILHVELEAAGSEYAAELDFCADHIGELSGAARMFLVTLGILAPETAMEQNARAVVGEYIPPQGGQS